MTSIEPARPGSASQLRTRTTDFGWVDGTQTVRKVIVEPGAQPPNEHLNRETEFFRATTGNVTRVETKALVDGPMQEIRDTDIEWDSLDGTTQASVKNAKDHVSTLYFHAGFGRLAVSDDPNNNRTTTYFDGFGRTKRVDVPSAADIDFIYGLTDGSAMRVTTERAGSGLHTADFYKCGNAIREEESRHSLSPSGFSSATGKLAIVTRTYTRLNQLATESMPFFAGEKPEYAAFGYDKAGRVASRTSPELDTDFWSYEGLTAKHTDARGVAHVTARDAAGRVARTATYEGTRPVETAFEYGPFDVVDAVRGPLGHAIVNLHDALGRRTQMTDPSAGVSTTGYNGFGEVRTETDAAGTRTFTYDTLGRVTEVQLSTGERESFVWDTAQHGLGQLAVAQMEPGPAADMVTVAYEYKGGHGRPSKELTTIGSGGTEYSLETEWDSWDRLKVQRYPFVGTQRLAVEFEYQANGTLAGLKNVANGKSFWHLTKQDATGVPEIEEFGEGITTRRKLDRQKRLKFLETAYTGEVLQRLSYEYGAGGLLKSRHDVPNDYEGRTTDFSALQKRPTSALQKWTTCGTA